MRRVEQGRGVRRAGVGPAWSLALTACAAFTVPYLSACGSSGNDSGSRAGDGGLDAGDPGAGGGGSNGGKSGAGGGTANGGGSAAGGSSASGGKMGAGGAAANAGGTNGAGGAATSSGTNGAGGAATSSGGSTGAGGAEPGTIDCRTDGDDKTTLVFVNRCASTLTYRGSDIESGTLAPGAFACVDIGSATETLSAKRYWGFAGDDPGNEHYTLAEFTFNTDFNDFDWYNISHVDAHNLPMRIEPVARPNCKTLTCAQDFLADCPEVGQVKNTSGDVVVCVSPDRNDGQSPVPLYFEACDDAYAWSGDDQNGDDPSPVRACAGEDWDITFCPPAG